MAKKSGQPDKYCRKCGGNLANHKPPELFACAEGAGLVYKDVNELLNICASNGMINGYGWTHGDPRLVTIYHGNGQSYETFQPEVFLLIHYLAKAGEEVSPDA